MRFTKKLIKESDYYEKYNNFNLVVKSTPAKDEYIIIKNDIMMFVIKDVEDIDENLNESDYSKYKEIYVAINKDEEENFKYLYENASKIGYTEFEKKLNKLIDSTVSVVNKRERPELLEIRNDIVKYVLSGKFVFYVIR